MNQAEPDGTKAADRFQCQPATVVDLRKAEQGELLRTLAHHSDQTCG